MTNADFAADWIFAGSNVIAWLLCWALIVLVCIVTWSFSENRKERS